MATHQTNSGVESPSLSHSAQRPAWRRRLVEIERGLSQSFRGESTLCGYCFVASVVVTMGIVLDISVIEWAMVILALSVSASSEMFQMVLQSLGSDLGNRLSRSTQKALRIGNAAVVVTRLGALLAIVLVYGAVIRRIW